MLLIQRFHIQSDLLHLRNVLVLLRELSENRFHNAIFVREQLLAINAEERMPLDFINRWPSLHVKS